MTLVVDASIALAWVLEDESGPTPSAAGRRVAVEGGIAPGFWRLEVANALRNGVRRKRFDEIGAARALQRLGRLRIDVDSETDSHAWAATRKLARQYDLTLYDAAYLELAVRRKLPLASRDADLLAAARAARVETITE